MIETTAVVIRTEPGYAWVEAEQEGGCQHCLASSACGTRVLGQVLGRRQSALRVGDSLQVQPGARVIIAVDDSVLLWSAALMYGLPLLSMIGLGALAQHATATDVAAMAGGLVGLVVGLWVAANLGRRGHLRARQPTIKCYATAQSCAPASGSSATRA